MEGSRLAERLWASSRTDGDLLAALRDAWRGPGDVSDALWWHAHPLAPTPAGTPDPASELAPLKAAVYSRAAASQPVLEVTDPATGEAVRSTAAERALEAAVRREAENAAALADLLAEFRSGRAPAAADPDTAAAASAGAEQLDVPSSPWERHRVLPPRRVRDILLLATGVAVGVLGLLGVQALGQLPQAPEAVAPSSPAPSPEAVGAVDRTAPAGPPLDTSGFVLVPPDEENPDPFWIFDAIVGHPPVADPPDFGPDIDASSIRSLVPAGAYSAYAARNVVDEYCLILAGGDGGWASNCLGADALRATGLWISAPVTDPATGVSVDMNVSWSADGLFMIGPSATTG